LPHDADYEVLGAEKCIRTQIEDAFPHAEVRIIEEAGKPHSVKTGIDLARNIFSQCWFDKAKTKDGLQALRHWHYKKHEQDGKTSLKPVHDWSSHGSMAFVYFAMDVEEVSAPRKKPKFTTHSWMA
jgi:phage terminase large subunit